MYGSIGAAWGALLPLLALLLVVPTLFCGASCMSLGGVIGSGFARPDGRTVTISVAWTPYLDNGKGAAGRNDGGCRAEASPMPPPLRLTRYELPESFDPASFPDRALFVCILARSDGAILAVRLAQPIRGGAADRALIAAIRDEWRFEGLGGSGTGWERVRLNWSAPADSPLVN